MKRNLSLAVAALFVLSITLLCATCSKEYSFEGGRLPDTTTVIVVPTSFTLAGAPLDCTNALVKGTYTVGTPLSASHNVAITVNVTAPGNYTLHTDTVNGISFSASGRFTTSGNQNITLSGSGVPDNPGLFTFTPSAGSSHCSFDVMVQNQQPLATYVLESGFGTTSPCTGTVAGTYTAAVPLTAVNTASISVYVMAKGNFTVQTRKVNGMVFTYTGTFTTTGSQYITLQGTGTPVSSGSFTVIPQIVGPHPLGGEACGLTIAVL